MRRMFDELEAEFEAGLRREAEQESLAAVRAEVGVTVLWEQLARRVGTEAAVFAGAPCLPRQRGRQLSGVPCPAGDRRHRASDPVWARGLGRPAGRTADAPAGAGGGRAPVPLALALRELARRREPVRVELVDGTSCDGTIESVGSDYLEVAEHDLGEARRQAAVRTRRFVGSPAVVAVTLPPGRR